jgi:hypothetical protein
MRAPALSIGLSRCVLWSSLCFVLGCPDEPDATTGAGETAGSSASAADDDDDDDDHGTPETPDDSATSGDPVDTTGGDPGSDDSSGSSATICDRYIRCAEALPDVPLSPIVGAYGPDGACWTMFDAEVCMHDCRAALMALSAGHRDVPACLECEVDDECTYLGPGMGCNAGRCTGAGPGDPCVDDTDCAGVDNGSCSDNGICVELCSDVNHPCVGEGLWCDLEQGHCAPGPTYEFCIQFSADCEACLENGCVFASLGPPQDWSCAEIPAEVLDDYSCMVPL